MDLRGRNLWVMAKGYTPDEGGMQTYAEGVAEAYSAAGARVTVFTQTSAGPRRERVGPVMLVDIGSGKSPLVPIRLLAAMRRELGETGAPDIVHGTTWRTSVPPMLLRLPFVTTFHGREFMYPSGIALSIMRKVARRARRIVAVSQYSAGRLMHRLGSDVSPPIVAWNGLSTDPFDGAEAFDPVKYSTSHSGIPLLYTLCRLEPRKNVASAVRACADARAAGYTFRYVIGGRGPDLARITALVRELDLEAEIEVAGFIPTGQMQQLYREADIFLHPQIEVDDGRDFEGFGIAIADAMATGTAVIAGNDGGTRELIKHGVDGYSVDGRDQNAVSAALISLLSDSAKRRSMGLAARKRAKSDFSWERHIQRIMNGIEMS